MMLAALLLCAKHKEEELRLAAPVSLGRAGGGGGGGGGVVWCGKGVMSLGHSTDIGLQLGKTCYPCSS